MCRYYTFEKPMMYDSDMCGYPGSDGCELGHSPSGNMSCDYCIFTHETDSCYTLIHGCDDSCPDFEPVVAPDPDMMRGGRDEA